jgi:PAS domain S-box-containing protein
LFCEPGAAPIGFAPNPTPVRIPWSQLRTGAVWLLIVAAAAGIGWWRAGQQRATMLQQWIDRAERCAVAFQTADVELLTATRADLSSPAYAAVKDRLRRLRAIGSGVRFVYLFRSTDTPGRVVFLADSEPEGSRDLSLPGDDYPEALQSPGLQAVLRDHRPATEGPLRDSYGLWVTAYAPVGHPPPGAPRTILGIDLDASQFSGALWSAGLTSAAIAFLALGLPFGVFVFLRREHGFHRQIRRLSAAIQQSHSAVLITSVERTIEYVNDGCVAMTGYRMDELLGQPVRLLLPGDMPEAERLAILRRLLAGERWLGEIRVRRRNGEVFPVRAAFSPVRDSSGRIVNFVAVCDDISEQKKTEDALRLARDQAESADRAKGEFLAVMSHELRTPLNGIIGFATLLTDTPLTPEQADYAETIRKSGEALLALTNELLDYSRIDAGRMQLDLQACPPRQIVEESVELLSTRAAEKSLELITTIAPDVPDYVLADPGRLRQVLVNLIGNAIKFTPSGEVEVALSALPAAPGDEATVRLQFVVRDTGIGIASENQDRLFKPFSQIDASNTRRYGGAGLGLAISQSLVHLMGGRIEVSSALGTGSEFRFEVPVRIVEPAHPLPPLPPRRVTLISANTRVRRSCGQLLRDWGLKVTTCENLSALPAEAAPDLLIVDILARDAALWPDLLRRHATLAGVPVVGLVPVTVSAAQRDELRESFRSLLKKPLRDSLFHAVLQSLLRG